MSRKTEEEICVLAAKGEGKRAETKNLCSVLNFSGQLETQ